MVSFEEAVNILTGSAGSLPGERVSLADSLNRILSEDVVSDMDMPPFNKSAMDGFACRRTDLGNVLTIVETIRAGDDPVHTIRKNQCAKIMTGGKVPEGANCVIMVEQTEGTGEHQIRFTGHKTADNIAIRGEDIRQGAVVLEKGTRIQPQHIAVLASMGAVNPLVSKRPIVSVFSTGDEIVEPHQTPEGAKIRNSNGPQLTAQVLSAGSVPIYMGILPDNPDETRTAIEKALTTSNIVLLTGGVSMGDFDFVPEVIKQLGVEIIFEKVAVKPGRPTVFGRKGNVFLFGLPGNPVSCFTIFELLVKPFMDRMMGCTEEAMVIQLPIGEGFSRKKADRISWTPVSIVGGHANPLEYHGSAHIHSLCQAKGLLSMKPGVFEFKKGDLVDVRLI
jgi:molybdopterin molybdotransferase